MKVTLKLFATLAAHLPAEARRAGLVELEVAPEATVKDVIQRHRLPPALCTLVLVNGGYVGPPEQEGWVLREGDVLAIWPPVGGG
jgi:molybdopterin converting factor small subunit